MNGIDEYIDEREEKLEKELSKLQKRIRKIEQDTLQHIFQQQEESRKIREDIERLKASDAWIKGYKLGKKELDQLKREYPNEEVNDD